MLKRLIIAVFGISLILALGSTVVADIILPKFPEDGTGVIGRNPNHPRFTNLSQFGPSQPTFRKPESAIRALPTGTPAPAPPSLIYFGDLQDYTGAPANYWTIPNAYGDNLLNTRFTVEAGFERTLKVAHIL